MVAISRRRPEVKTVPGNKSSTFGKVLQAGLGIGGAVAGGVVGGPAGAAAGGGLGLSGGGLAREFIDKPLTPDRQVQVGQPSGGVPTNNAVSRRMGTVPSDSLQTFGNSLAALGQAPPDIQQEYSGPLFQAYTLEYNNSKGVA